MIMLDYAAYRRKLRGCFVGKAIGGTLGMPLEGYLGTKEVTYYDPVPTGMVETSAPYAKISYAISPVA